MVRVYTQPNKSQRCFSCWEMRVRLLATPYHNPLIFRAEPSAFDRCALVLLCSVLCTFINKPKLSSYPLPPFSSSLPSCLLSHSTKTRRLLCPCVSCGSASPRALSRGRGTLHLLNCSCRTCYKPTTITTTTTTTTTTTLKRRAFLPPVSLKSKSPGTRPRTSSSSLIRISVSGNLLVCFNPLVSSHPLRTCNFSYLWPESSCAANCHATLP
jgi:hypothetical protein